MTTSTIATIFTAACMLGTAIPGLCAVTPEQILNKAYSKFDKKHHCWIAESPEGQLYCMKLDRHDQIQTDTGERHYVLVSGEAVDDKGESNGAHVTMGMVGAFVLEVRDGKVVMLAENDAIPMGASGSAPSKWKLQAIGPTNYMGWTNTWGDCHQGYCGSRYAILAPYGKGIRDLGGFVTEYEDGGSCSDKKCEQRSTALSATVKVDSSASTRVYPLLVTVTGKLNGKDLAPKTWTLQFDTKQWRYREPAKWPLGERDF